MVKDSTSIERALRPNVQESSCPKGQLQRAGDETSFLASDYPRIAHVFRSEQGLVQVCEELFGDLVLISCRSSEGAAQ
jgi:hypothetical protein